MSVVKLHLIEEGTSPQPSVKKPKAPRATAKRLKKDEPISQETAAKPATKAASKTKAREATVSDVMQASVISCGTSASLNDAARLMWEHDLGTVVVVNEQFKPVSMITDRDICMAAYTQGVALAHGQVASAMAKKMLTVPCYASIDELTELMAMAQVRRMPVVDEQGKLVGVVGMSDLMKDAHKPSSGRKRSNAGAKLADLMGELYAS